MITVRELIAISVLATGLGGEVRAQPLPPPIDLGIQNISQETGEWCWVAVAQQIVLASRGAQGTPPQCAMVALANNQNPAFCCNGNPQCVVPGSFQQIQWL